MLGRGILLENLKGYNNQYDQLYSRVKFTKVIDKILIQDVIKILESIGQDSKLAEIYLQYSEGNTRRLEHLISHSICIAKFNGKAAVIGSNLDYAAIHQFGGQAGRNKSVEIPARPYLQLTPEDFEEILSVTENFLGG